MAKPKRPLLADMMQLQETAASGHLVDMGE